MNTILKIAAAAVALTLCFTAKAQDVQTQEAAIEEAQGILAQAPADAPKPYKVYCEITSINRIFSNKKTVELDFGQSAKFWSTDRNLVDENGRTIDFNSALDVANYMASRGWELEEASIELNINNGTTSNPTTHWVMSKMVTSDEQITEGLLTAGMLKKN